MNVSPLLRELVLHASRRNTLRRDTPADMRLTQVILDQLETLPAEPLQLPMPNDSEARKAAELLQADPGEPASLAEAAWATGASKRTLERLFLAETHMTFGRWRQRLRLVEALRMLAKGQAVTARRPRCRLPEPERVHLCLRRELGTTPGRYFRSVQEA